MGGGKGVGLFPVRVDCAFARAAPNLTEGRVKNRALEGVKWTSIEATGSEQRVGEGEDSSLQNTRKSCRVKKEGWRVL